MEDQNEIVNSFNNFFATIGNTLAEKLPQPTTDFKSYLVDQLDTVPTPNFYEIGPAEILDIINEFSHKKATRPDTIPIRSLKENKLVLVPIVAHLVNLVSVSGISPNCMKIARVKPLFKKGDKLSCNNYRPISVLNSVSKVVEKVLSNQVREFLQSNNEELVGIDKKRRECKISIII